MKRITVIVGVIMAVMLAFGMGVYGVAKAADSEKRASGQGLSTAGVGGQGLSSGGVGGEGTTGSGQGNGAASGQGESGQGSGLSGSDGATGEGARGLGNRSDTGARVGSSMGKPQEYKPAGQVNINTAAASELILVPGIDRSLANQIVEYRQSNGPFDSVDELISVQGADKEKLDKAKPFLKIQGASNLPPDLQVTPPKPNPFPQYSTESQ